ncbi:MAG: HTTM domain-containing protein [Algoriphagus sp.]|jgi:hypothetical protein|nr:HTTM domain-containing protein [Algoriphagus sp.]
MDFQKQIGNLWAVNSAAKTDLPLLFAARMMVIFLVWVRGMKHILPPFLPFIPGMEILREFPWLYILLDWIYWISLVAVVSGFRYQQFSIVLGALVMLVILGAKPQFSNSFLFAGCILFLIGMYRLGLEWIFRVQISLLYLGAGINKLFDPDWLSGRYFDFFLSEVYVNPVSSAINYVFAGDIFVSVLSWCTILVELTFGIWALIGKRTVILFLFIQLFHLAMLVVTLGELSFLFYFLMSVSSYLVLPWGRLKGMRIRFLADSGFSVIFRFFDSENFFTWVEIPKNRSKTPLQKIRTIFLFFFLKPFFFAFFVIGVTILCLKKESLFQFIDFVW